MLACPCSALSPPVEGNVIIEGGLGAHPEMNSLKTSQKLRMLSRSLFDCKSLNFNVMTQVSQFVIIVVIVVIVEGAEIKQKVYHFLNDSLTRSPIELSWTAKKYTHLRY